MQHADLLIKRILFLEGLPNLQELNKLMIGETVRELLDCDLKLEQLGIPDLKAAILHAESVPEYVSRDLFRKIPTDEEEHVDYLDRKSVVSETNVADRIDRGGDRYIKKTP